MTPAELRALLRYDPATGAFTRGSDPSRVLGWDQNAYLAIEIGGQRYYLHRLAFLYMTDRWPDGDVDHIDGDRKNNRWANLRDVAHAVNMQNIRAPHRDNATGLLGVSFDKQRCKYEGCIQVAGRRVRRRFDTAEQAHEFYVQNKRIAHPGGTL